MRHRIASLVIALVAACDVPVSRTTDAAGASPLAPDGVVVDELGRVHYLVDLEPGALAGLPRVRVDRANFAAYHRSEVTQLVHAMEQAHDIVATSVISLVGVAFSAYLTPEQAKALEADPRVLAVAADRYLESSAGPVWTDVQQGGELASWGTRAVNPGGGTPPPWVRVYVIDGGVVPSSQLAVVQRVNPTQPSRPDAIQCYRHAQHVASIIGERDDGAGSQGVAPGVSLVSVAAFPGTATGCVETPISSVELVNALEWIKRDITARGQVAVVNLSINDRFANDTTFGPDGTVTAKMRSLATPTAKGSRGALIVQSAGNQYQDACDYAFAPAAPNDGVLVVGALNNHGQAVRPLNGIAAFNSGPDVALQPGSNFGACVEVWAPGLNIWAQWGDGTSAYRFLSGTSMAAPHVAGLAAMLATPDMTAQDLEAAVRARLDALGSTSPSGAIRMPTLSPLPPGVPHSSAYAGLFVGDQPAVLTSASNSAYVVYDDTGRVFLDSQGAAACTLVRRPLPSGTTTTISTSATGAFPVTGWGLGSFLVTATDCPPTSGYVTVRSAPRLQWRVNGAVMANDASLTVPAGAVVGYTSEHATSCDLYLTWRRDFFTEPYWGYPQTGLPTSNSDVGLPSTPATYHYTLYCEDAFGARREARLNLFVTEATVDDAQPLSQSVPGQVSVGAPFSATITMRNDGATTWTQPGGYQLGSDAFVFGANRVALPVAEVEPGEAVTFTIAATAPASSGTYAFPAWRMWRGTQPFGDVSSATSFVVVGACGPSAPCTPGETRTVECGDCGARVDSCSSTCEWVQGACSGEGACTPGDTLPCCPEGCGPLGCSCTGERSCTDSCAWGPCAGYACYPNECE